jgi:hypothetical protein
MMVNHALRDAPHHPASQVHSPHVAVPSGVLIARWGARSCHRTRAAMRLPFASGARLARRVGGGRRPGSRI